MATRAAYAAAIRQATGPIARQMGVRFGGADVQVRVLLRLIVMVFATLIKALVDAGAITDQQLQDALNAAAADAYDEEPQTPTPETPGG